MSSDNWIEKQWAETDPRPRDELLAELKSLRARLAEAERERDERFGCSVTVGAGLSVFGTVEAIGRVQKMRRDADAQGEVLSGMAYQIANSLAYVQGIAREALFSLPITGHSESGD